MPREREESPASIASYQKYIGTPRLVGLADGISLALYYPQEARKIVLEIFGGEDYIGDLDASLQMNADHLMSAHFPSILG